MTEPIDPREPFISAGQPWDKLCTCCLEPLYLRNGIYMEYDSHQHEYYKHVCPPNSEDCL